MIYEGGAIHPQACVDADCIFGDGTTVWQFASVIRGSRIGTTCTIASGAIIDGAHLGSNCRISAGAQLHPGTRLGDGVFVGPGAIFCNDMWPRVSKDGFDFELLSQRATTIAEDGASIGAGAIILPGIVIGKGALVAAGVVCDRSVPDSHILRRDGSIEPMPEDGGRSRRMKWAA